MPEPANVPPPTAADVGGPVTETTGSTSVINLPDPPDLPPPTFKDIAAPAAPPAPEAAPGTGRGSDRRRPLRRARRRRQSRSAGPGRAARARVGSKLARIIDRKPTAPRSRRSIPRATTRRSGSADDGATERAKQAIAHLRNADADGMDPADYPVPVDQGRRRAGGARRSRDAADRSRCSTYARHATIGRVHYSRVSARHLSTSRSRRSRSTC